MAGSRSGDQNLKPIEVAQLAITTPVPEVVRRMLELKVHHLFVSDGEMALIGVISPLDVLRRLAD